MGDVLDTMAVITFMPEGPPGLDMIERHLSNGEPFLFRWLPYF